MANQLLRGALGFLKNPERGFHELESRSLEDVAFSYAKLLLLLSIVAGAASFLFNTARTLYFDIFLGVDVNYPRVFNYSTSYALGTMVNYIVVGTLVVFLASLVIGVFVRRMRYTELLKKVLSSMTPILLFGWFPSWVLVLALWSIFLFVTGIKLHREKKIDAKSIEQRV